MKRPFALCLASAVAATACVAVSTLAPAPASATVVTSNAAFFDDAYPRLTRETFESTPGTRVCNGPLSSSNGDTCFPRGGLRPGIRYLSDVDAAFGDFASYAAGVLGSPSKQLGVNRIEDTLILDMTSPVDTVGVNLAVYNGSGSCQVVVRYVDLSASSDFSTPCSNNPATPTFLGIKADRLIDSVSIAGDAYELIDNVRFGLRAPNAFAFGAVRQQRATGTATLAVKVPTVGTTTAAGPQVATSSVDSARPRTVVLRIAAKGAALRTLRQRGRVTVTVPVRFKPNGGTARTRNKRVTLVLQR